MIMIILINLIQSKLFLCSMIRNLCNFKEKGKSFWILSNVPLLLRHFCFKRFKDIMRIRIFIGKIIKKINKFFSFINIRWVLGLITNFFLVSKKRIQKMILRKDLVFLKINIPWRFLKNMTYKKWITVF